MTGCMMDGMEFNGMCYGTCRLTMVTGFLILYDFVVLLVWQYYTCCFDLPLKIRSSCWIRYTPTLTTSQCDFFLMNYLGIP
jgi:hypothetical protein